MRFSLSILFVFISITMQSQTITNLYVGGYSKGGSEGIYQFKFNTNTGELTEKKLIIHTKNPSYFVLSRTKNFLFTVNESNNYKKTKGGAISSYKISHDGTFKKISEFSSYGSGPCHLALNEKEDKIVVSNYGGGNFSIYDISKTGELKAVSQTVYLNKENTPAHTHSARFYKSELFVADLGINTFEQYSFDNKKYIHRNSISMAAGSGPRHFTMAKNGSFIYIINEYAGTIATLKRNKNIYTKTHKDISTLRNDYKGENFSADIHLSKDERFLYGSNRGENSIVVFKRNKENGLIDKIQNISTRGDWPRNFTIDPTGKFLLVANQKSNNITVFSIDKKTGTLTFLSSAKHTNATCLKF